MKRKLLLLLLLLYPGWLMAETINGKLDEVYLNGNTITVDGVTYKANMEATKVYYGKSVVGEESLSPGDEVQLIFSDEQVSGELRQLIAIILLSASKKGLDS